MKLIGDRLRDLREARNLKQTDVAKALCISNKILSSYERNISVPTIDNLKNLCEFYNVSADYLLQIELEKAEALSAETSAPMMVSPKQKKLLSYFERLNTENKEAILGLMILYYKEQQRKQKGV